jgi:hypothetical protein
MKGATVLTVSTRAVLDACAAMGLDTEALLAAAELAHAEVSDQGPARSAIPPNPTWSTNTRWLEL